MTRMTYHKFKAIPTEVDGKRFASKKEAKYYADNKLRVKSGEVLFFLMQVPLLLPGGTVYRVDFVNFHADGSVHFVDVKGMRTQVYKIKKREIEAIYPITIEEV